jgi:hypothetical protein
MRHNYHMTPSQTMSIYTADTKFDASEISLSISTLPNGLLTAFDVAFDEPHSSLYATIGQLALDYIFSPRLLRLSTRQ